MSASILKPDPDVIESDPVDKLSSVQSARFSIESAKLKITAGDRNRRIYGDIHVNGGIPGTAYSVYHRTEAQAETVPSERCLTLCGPAHCVEFPEIIYVDLHEAEEQAPFLQERVPFSPLNQYSQNQSYFLRATGQDGTLTISITKLSPSVPSRILLDIVDVNEDEDWLVTGKVTAIQTVPLPGGRQIKRSVPLLNRPDNDPIKMKDVPVVHLINPVPTSSRAIPLDRDIVVAPLHLEREFVVAMNSFVRGEGGETGLDPADLNGEGSFLTVAIELKFKCDDLVCSVRAESKRIELSSGHEVGWAYFDYMEGHVKRGKLDDEKVLKIMVMAYTFHDLFDDWNAGVDECTLPLFIEAEEDDGLCSDSSSED